MSSEQQISRLGKAFISYGSYHSNTINKIIHIIFVPTIFATLMMMFAEIKFSVQVAGFKIGAAEIGFSIACAFYLYTSLSFGVLMIAVSLGCVYIWRHLLVAGKDQSEWFKYYLIVFVFAWIMQFIGHGVFEKRKPALFDNLLQTLVAPMFVMIQVLLYLGLGTEDMKKWEQKVQKIAAQRRQKDKSN